MSLCGSSRFKVGVILPIEERGLHIPALGAQPRAGQLVSDGNVARLLTTHCRIHSACDREGLVEVVVIAASFHV
jgi:hypothetical protein